MLRFQGHPQDGGLYTEYRALRNETVVGRIIPGGFFTPEPNIIFSTDERVQIRAACIEAYSMPSEYGCFGVGEEPTRPYDDSRCVFI